MTYSDDDLLWISGIQHYAFCNRQWALAYVEGQWQDNYLTIEGSWLHRIVDDPFRMDKTEGVVHLRSVHVKSKHLGLYGIVDLLELSPLDDAIAKSFIVSKYPGRWSVMPIEYKHGKEKSDDTDEVQLCAQAMCLEEMYGIQIHYGAFFYGKTKRRVLVTLNDALRHRVEELSQEMHAIVSSGKLPDAEPRRVCHSCSLADICMSPDLKNATSVGFYLKQLRQ